MLKSKRKVNERRYLLVPFCAICGFEPHLRCKCYNYVTFLTSNYLGICNILLFPESASFPNVSVEILGAFLGVIAAIILGEILKEFEKEKQGKDLAREIETELKDIKIMLEADENEPIPYPVWTSSLMSGALMTLSSDIRRFLTLVYKEIELFNYRRTKDQKEEAHYYAKVGEHLMKISRVGISKIYVRELMKKQVAEEIMKKESEKERE